MYAIVEIAGKQYKVSQNDKLYVPRLDAQVDESVTFDRILLVADGDDIKVGSPVVGDITVTARVIGHVKADKVIVFKKKRRKGYRVKNGHRQPYTQIEIGDLGATDKAKKTETASKKKASKATEEAPAEPAAAE
ncbi:MAG: 50S ribosomal protein L21 [Rhodothermales bacterium]